MPHGLLDPIVRTKNGGANEKLYWTLARMVYINNTTRTRIGIFGGGVLYSIHKI